MCITAICAMRRCLFVVVVVSSLHSSFLCLLAPHSLRSVSIHLSRFACYTNTVNMRSFRNFLLCSWGRRVFERGYCVCQPTSQLDIIRFEIFNFWNAKEHILFIRENKKKTNKKSKRRRNGDVFVCMTWYRWWWGWRKGPPKNEQII